MFLHQPRTWGWLLAAAVCLGLVGCSPDERPDKTQMAPVEYFRATQANTITPDGPILMSTVQEVGPNLLQYETAEGGVYQVRYSSQGEGYRYFDVRRVERETIVVSSPASP